MLDEEKYAKMFESVSRIDGQLRTMQLPQVDWKNVCEFIFRRSEENKE